MRSTGRSTGPSTGASTVTRPDVRARAALGVLGLLLASALAGGCRKRIERQLLPEDLAYVRIGMPAEALRKALGDDLEDQTCPDYLDRSASECLAWSKDEHTAVFGLEDGRLTIVCYNAPPVFSLDEHAVDAMLTKVTKALGGPPTTLQKVLENDLGYWAFAQWPEQKGRLVRGYVGGMDAGAIATLAGTDSDPTFALMYRTQILKPPPTRALDPDRVVKPEEIAAALGRLDQAISERRARIEQVRRERTEVLSAIDDGTFDTSKCYTRCVAPSRSSSTRSVRPGKTAKFCVTLRETRDLCVSRASSWPASATTSTRWPGFGTPPGAGSPPAGTTSCCAPRPSPTRRVAASRSG